MRLDWVCCVYLYRVAFMPVVLDSDRLCPLPLLPHLARLVVADSPALVSSFVVCI